MESWTEDKTTLWKTRNFLEKNNFKVEDIDEVIPKSAVKNAPLPEQWESTKVLVLLLRLKVKWTLKLNIDHWIPRPITSALMDGEPSSHFQSFDA